MCEPPLHWPAAFCAHIVAAAAAVVASPQPTQSSPVIVIINDDDDDDGCDDDDVSELWRQRAVENVDSPTATSVKAQTRALHSGMQQSLSCLPKIFYSYCYEKYNKSNLKFLMARWISWRQIMVDKQPAHAWCNIHKCSSEWPLVPRCRKVAQIAKQIFCKLLKL